jgi:hypothetical protein
MLPVFRRIIVKRQQYIAVIPQAINCLSQYPAQSTASSGLSLPLSIILCRFIYANIYIRAQRKENLLVAMKARLGYYHSQKAEVSTYASGNDCGSKGIVDENSEAEKTENDMVARNGVLGALQGEVFETIPLGLLCQNR